MTLRLETDTPTPLWPRLADLGRAARALFAAALRKLRRSESLIYNNRNDGPPDLDELWRDFNRKLGGLFGKGGGQPPQRGGAGDGGGPFQPDIKSAGIGLALIGGVVVLVWLGSGVFIVQEGWQGVVTSFGRYSQTRDAGIQFRWPYPFQAHETVAVTQLRSAEVGRNTVCLLYTSDAADE